MDLVGLVQDFIVWQDFVEWQVFKKWFLLEFGYYIVMWIVEIDVVVCDCEGVENMFVCVCLDLLVVLDIQFGEQIGQICCFLDCVLEQVQILFFYDFMGDYIVLVDGELDLVLIIDGCFQNFVCKCGDLFGEGDDFLVFDNDFQYQVVLDIVYLELGGILVVDFFLDYYVFDILDQVGSQEIFWICIEVGCYVIVLYGVECLVDIEIYWIVWILVVG